MYFEARNSMADITGPAQSMNSHNGHSRDAASKGHVPSNKAGDTLPDAQLLAAYRDSRSADLFARIYARHGAMVYRTARRLTGNRQDAEDVTQVVFTFLARRPEVVTSSLGGWLHAAAHARAMKHGQSQTRRQRREQAAARRQDEVMERGESELRKELDAALGRLKPALREAVMLRYLAGHSQEEAARLAGCPRGTLSRRAAKGLEHLRTVLARRGVVVTPVLLVTFLGQDAAKNGPAALAASISSMAATSVKVAAKSLFWIKVIARATAVTAAATVTTLTVTALRRQPPPVPPPAPVVRGPVVAPFAPAGALDMGLPRNQRAFSMSLMPKIAGSHVWEDGTLTIKSSGLDVWGNHDSCHFVYQMLAGDGAISARIVSVENTAKNAKAGVMLRQSLEPETANVFLEFKSGGKDIEFQFRPTAGAETSGMVWVKDIVVPYRVKLVRRGNTVTGSISPDGTNYKKVASKDLGLPEKVYIGLAVTSHHDGVLNTSVFDEVTVTTER
jgi:RNA polymerase sigma factor (sigma-70 family)